MHNKIHNKERLLIWAFFLKQIQLTIILDHNFFDLLFLDWKWQRASSVLLEGTSYPTGGENTHAVISSHRGLPQAKLFTDLPKLTLGDSFYIEINGRTLAYQVDQIKTVEPTDTKDLRIEKGQDFVTLLTCTPYMVNSHRLLVRGHRVPYHAKEVQKEVQKVSENKRFFLYGLLAACILIFLLLIYLFRQSFKIRNRS
ncbi:class C sortase [Enterococcus faecium]|nr:class C sortase [Enterococcus faecium]EGP5212741.1 class C sortase [Enterococcus faecium]MUN44040.1 class C sortase [Enterococcus faecium]PQC20848.1 class C sortase [Enterococcus faecium]PQC57443.1 class C sortase [Enterococcus faecium]